MWGIVPSEAPPTLSAASSATLRGPFGRPLHHQTESGVLCGSIKKAERLRSARSLYDRDEFNLEPLLLQIPSRALPIE